MACAGHASGPITDPGTETEEKNGQTSKSFGCGIGVAEIKLRVSDVQSAMSNKNHNYEEVRERMRRVTDTSAWPQLGERAVWDMDSADHECDCPGPPPQFHLPPPPRPPFVIDSDCSDNPISDLETCKAVPVIDPEYHSSPAIPFLSIILIGFAAVMVLLFIVIVLVVWKKRKVSNFLPRKSSPQNHCDASTANGVIYEDLTNVRPRALPPHCPPGQTPLPSIEMIDVNSYPNHAGFSPVFICPSPVPDSYNSQDLFNPVYEELSNGSGERGETDSEGLPQAPISEDEFAEDELSLGGEVEPRQECERRSGNSSLHGSTGNDLSRDIDSSDADDRFLVNPGRNFSLPPGYREKERRVPRGLHAHYNGGDRRPKSLDRRRGWRKGPPPPSQGPPERSEFHEGLLLDTLLHLYPNVGTARSHRPSYAVNTPVPMFTPNEYESIPVLGHVHGHHPRGEIFTTFRAAQGTKNQSQDSSFGSDSGYSNNTSGGRASSRGRKDQRLSNHSDLVLS